MKLTVFKPYIASVVLLAVMGGLVFVPFQAWATVPTIDYVAIAKLVLQLGELIIQTAEAVFQSVQLSALVVKEYVLDPAVKFLASLMLQALTRAIIGWIQDGGNTNFISNLQAAASRVADEAAGEFLNQLAGTNLCSPFAVRLRLAFQIPRLRDRLTCTATDIFRNLQTSYDEFLRDFTRGGWLAFNSTLVGGNNYIDALINSYDEKLRRESRRIAVLNAQYQAGQGFLGVRIKKQDCQDFAEYENPICTTVDVQTTPGKLVVDQLSHVFNSGIDQAVNADEIAEAIDAIIIALINKLISSAQAGLLANNESSGIYDRGFRNPPPPPPPPADLLVSQAPVPTKTGILAGEQVTFSVTIKNQGLSNVAVSFNSNFQIDINFDGTIDETLGQTSKTAGLAVGEEKAVTSGSWKTVSGTHRVILCADEPNPVVNESLEINNCNLGGTGVFKVGPRPDLTVSENPSIFSGAPTKDQVLTFKGTIKNIDGAAATSTFQNVFKIDLGNNGTTDVTLSPNPTIANLLANTSQSVISGNWTALEGTHRVILCADDPSQVIIETNEVNNCNPTGTGVFIISP